MEEKRMERRSFLKYTAAVTVGTGLLGASAANGDKKRGRGHPKKYPSA